jgi:hypothetical protein
LDISIGTRVASMKAARIETETRTEVYAMALRNREGTLVLVVCIAVCAALGCNKHNLQNVVAAENQTPEPAEGDDETSPEAGYSSFGGSSGNEDFEIPLREEYLQSQEEEAVPEEAADEAEDEGADVEEGYEEEYEEEYEEDNHAPEDEPEDDPDGWEEAV